MLKAARSSWPWIALPVAAIFALNPGGLAPFGPAKWAVVPALVLAGVATLAFYGQRPPALRGVSAWALPAFVGWSAVSALFGLDRVYAWTGTPERHLGVVAWLLALLAWWAGRALDRAARRLVMLSTAATAAALGAWAGAEAIGWRPLHLVGIGDRPVGPLGSSAFLGAAALLVAPVALGWLTVERGRIARGLAALASIGGLVALGASGARAALAGALVAAVVALVVHRQRRVVGFAVVRCALAVAVVTLASGAGGRVSDIASDREGGARGRLDEWRVALRVIGAHPVVGTGPEGYRIAFGRAVDDRYERAHGRDPLPDRAHSAPLDVAATTGLVGLVLYALAVGGAVWAAVDVLRREPPQHAGFAVAVIAYFAQSLFLFPIAELEPIVWLFAGICAASARLGAPSTTSRTPRPQTLKVGVAGLLAVVAFAAGVFDVVADRRAKRELAAVAADTPTQGSAARLRPDQVRYRLIDARADAANGSSRGLRRAIADVNDALRVSRRDPVARREKARLLVTQARRDPSTIPSARAYLERLASDDPRDAEVLLRLGVIRELAGDERGAITSWRRAEYLAPRSAAASSNLAVAYARAGRTDDARAAARRALRRDPTNASAQDVLDSLDEHGT